MNIKQLGLGGALAATLAGGTALGRFTAASSAPVAVTPVALRWLGPTSDQAHPYYYGVLFAVQQGATSATREVICPTDGNPPSLDGYPYTTAATLCTDLAALADKVGADVPALAPSIASSNAPDMARPSTPDAG